MKIAILSDIHGNFEALKSVWADIEKNDVDNIVCLGDMIGYGPEPEAVVSFIIEKGIISIVGNHELGLLDDTRLIDMSEDASASILITRKLISNDALSYIKQLPRRYILNDMLFVHGMPPDSATTYLNWLDDGEIVSRMNTVEQRMVFVGHTHRPICYSFDKIDLDVIFLQEGIIQLSRDTNYIVNVGSGRECGPRTGHDHLCKQHGCLHDSLCAVLSADAHR
ncbi:MAG: metallophosphoesterase [Desulfosarcina sp.]|nr:metallophosphoesterase [Desulfosarcina sp.]MBC2744592.1 metallophosphoesterase [Desulfosarcina sp.]MBC2767502.1 metallophosphoesterase [Desulfosarcina sp.]